MKHTDEIPDEQYENPFECGYLFKDFMLCIRIGAAIGLTIAVLMLIL